MIQTQSKMISYGIKEVIGKAQIKENTNENNSHFYGDYTNKWNLIDKTLSELSPQKRSQKIEKHYIFDGNRLGSLPMEIHEGIFHSIDKSQYILQLETNWDDEGSEKYQKSTWISAVKFILNYAKTLHKYFSIKIDAPNIYHAPKGSIDIFWENPNYRLLINISKNGEDAMFYADDLKKQVSEGAFNIKQFNHFLIPIAIYF